MSRVNWTTATGKFLNYHRANNVSEKQIKHYETTFRDFERFLVATNRAKTVEVLTTETFEDFAIWLKAQPRHVWRGSTVRSMVGVAGHLKDLRAFVRWCQKKGALIDWELEVPKPKVPKRLFPILTDAELAALWQSDFLSRKSGSGIRNRAIFALLLDTGMRLTECATLTPKQLFPGFVRVIGKGDKERLCPLTSEAAEYVQSWLKERAKQGEIPGDPTGPTIFQLTNHGIAQVIERLSAETGIAVFPHKIRHTSATLMIRRGMNLHAVQRILGHSSVTTTEGYLALCSEDIQAQHATGSPFLALTSMLPVPQVAPVMKKRRYR